MMMRLLLAGILSLGSGGWLLAQPVLQVTEGFVYAPLAGRAMTGGFGTLLNTSDAPLTIVGARSSAATAVELHEMAHEGGMMRMRKLDRVEVPARGTRVLRPGGDHLMLIALTSPLAVGGSVDVVFVLDDGREVTATLPVRAREGVR
jgi:periplasmic copper chaperone A